MSITTAVQAIHTALAADVTFSGLLSGGVYSEATNGVDEISRQKTPSAFDANDEISPCVIIKPETTVPIDALNHSARTFVALYFYQRRGYDAIDAAKDRAYVLLHRQCVTSGGVYDCRHVDDPQMSEDDVLDCSARMSRFALVLNRVAV